MLQLNNLKNVKPLTTRLEIRCHLTSTQEDDVQLTPNEYINYLSLIGSLSYLAICTRPDISFDVSGLSRKCHATSIFNLSWPSGWSDMSALPQKSLSFSRTHRFIRTHLRHMLIRILLDVMKLGALQRVSSSRSTALLSIGPLGVRQW